jgi:NADH-quinone oxidoreductase subunit L
VLSTLGGFIGVPYALSSRDINYIEHTLEPVVAEAPAAGANEATHSETSTAAHATHSAEEIREEQLLAGLSVLIALAGIGTGWLLFQKRPLRQMPSLLENKYYVDEIYNAAVIRPIELVSREGLWKIFDIGVIDGVLHSIGDAVKELGRFARYLQAGFVRGYAAIILTGALIIIGVFAYYSFQAMNALR